METTVYNRKQILIIHHDVYQANNLKQNLGNYPYDVTTLYEGNEGLEFAEQNHPDVILASAHLKDVDGIDLCWMIRQAPEIAHTPYFLIAEYINHEEKINAFRTGVDGIFDNTTSIRELYTRIEAILKRSDYKAPSNSGVKASLHGKIPHFTVVEVLQLLNISQKSGTVVLMNESQKGEIGFWEGKIVWARQGELIGEEAVHAIACWKNGYFSFEKDLIHPIVNVHAATMQLILDCCKVLDEQGAEI
ncbi:DUF4388 domain-containing protein [candidate division KSB1 bacterium]|nr:DUF4388 domain-containing protein [candidate division KSB1 bacterium]